MPETVKIYFINNHGGGFSDYLEVPANTSAGDLFAQKVGGDPADYLIRVNCLPTTSGQLLLEGDRVSITPRKVSGA